MEEPVIWVRAGDLERYLEHDGTINDDEVDGTYLEQLSASGAWFDEDDPAVLSVVDHDGELRASISDGNHRLLLALAESPDTEVPVHLDRSGDTRHPGFPYDGALG